MLPSFRLIAATFLCGFIVVFAGLRLAASLNDIHEGLPVMAAHAAPVAAAEARGGSAATPAVPVMYDLRIAVRAAQTPEPINVTALVIDRSSPLVVVPLLPAAPPEEAASPAAEPAEPVDAVAAISPEQAAVAEPAPETPQPDVTVVAAVDPQAVPQDSASEPAHEPAAAMAETTPDDAPASATVQTVDLSPVVSAAVSSEPQPSAPAVAPARKPPAVKAAPRRATVRKKRTRVAHRTAAPVSSFDATTNAMFGLLATPSQ